jgi:hypothetical protein
MSQSRTKKDKVANTARWHIMKNRYGSDGMTWNMKADLSMGHFEILGEYDDTEEYQNQPEKPKNDYNKVQKEEKELLLEKFKNFKIE